MQPMTPSHLRAASRVHSLHSSNHRRLQRDGLDDFYARGFGSASTQGYILFGPVDLHDVDQIDLFADIVVDETAWCARQNFRRCEQ